MTLASVLPHSPPILIVLQCLFAPMTASQCVGTNNFENEYSTTCIPICNNIADISLDFRAPLHCPRGLHLKSLLLSIHKINIYLCFLEGDGCIIEAVDTCETSEACLTIPSFYTIMITTPIFHYHLNLNIMIIAMSQCFTIL